MKRRRAGKYTVLIAAALLLIILSAGTTPAETNEQTAIRYFTETMELPPAAACGIMANLYLESGFVPDITGYGGAYGICSNGNTCNATGDGLLSMLGGYVAAETALMGA